MSEYLGRLIQPRRRRRAPKVEQTRRSPERSDTTDTLIGKLMSVIVRLIGARNQRAMKLLRNRMDRYEVPTTRPSFDPTSIDILRMKDGSGKSLGVYSYKNDTCGTIRINLTYVLTAAENGNFERFVIDTIDHELGHAYQHQEEARMLQLYGARTGEPIPKDRRLLSIVMNTKIHGDLWKMIGEIVGYDISGKTDGLFVRSKYLEDYSPEVYEQATELAKEWLLKTKNENAGSTTHPRIEDEEFYVMVDDALENIITPEALSVSKVSSGTKHPDEDLHRRPGREGEKTDWCSFSGTTLIADFDKQRKSLNCWHFKCPKCGKIRKAIKQGRRGYRRLVFTWHTPPTATDKPPATFWVLADAELDTSKDMWQTMPDGRMWNL